MQADWAWPVGHIWGPCVGDPPESCAGRYGLIPADGRRLGTASYEDLFSVVGTIFGGPRWRRRLPRKIARRMERHRRTRPSWFHIPDLRGHVDAVAAPIPAGMEAVEPLDPPLTPVFGYWVVTRQHSVDPPVKVVSE